MGGDSLATACPACQDSGWVFHLSALGSRDFCPLACPSGIRHVEAWPGAISYLPEERSRRIESYRFGITGPARLYRASMVPDRGASIADTRAASRSARDAWDAYEASQADDRTDLMRRIMDESLELANAVDALFPREDATCLKP